MRTLDKNNFLRTLSRTCACLFLAATFVAAADGRSTTYQLDIPAQSLSDALQALALASQHKLLYDTVLVEGKSSPALKGDFTAEEAVKRLLSGTDLSYEVTEDGLVLIRPPSAPAASTSSRAANAQGLRWANTSSASPFQGEDAQWANEDGRTEEALKGADESPFTIQEVIVTAQKRQERLIDVPVAATVLSADRLTKLGATQLRDIANDVPGLSFTTLGAGYSQVSLRGVNMTLNLGPTVAFYVDDVPYGSSSSLTFGYILGLDAAPFDMERIEVLKGPQGTLYGASSIGGLIKYVTRRPDATRFGADVQTGISTTQDGGVSYNGAVTVNAPIVTDKFALRATGYYSHDGGFVDDVARGEKDVNRSNIYGARVDLLFTPTEKLNVRLGGFLQDIDRGAMGVADYSPAGVPVDGSLDQRRSLSESFEQRFRLVSGTVTYDLEWASVTSITGYQTGRTRFVDDFTRSYVPILALPAFGSRSYSAVGIDNYTVTDKFTQEVRLASATGRPLEWMIGGFYNHETTEPHTIGALPFDLSGRPVPNDILNISSPERFEELAALGNLTWHLTEKFDVSGGLRYTHNREDFRSDRSGILSPVSRPAIRSGENVSTYLANARYRFSDQATAYVRYATGYRPGGPNHAVVDPLTGFVVPPAFKSDSLKSYEIGFKGETEDRRFGMEIAGYDLDWNNIIVAATRGTTSFRANAAGGASVRGAELTLTAHSTRALTLTGAFAYTDAHMREADVDLRAAKGERLPNVPRFTTNLNADYELPLGNWQPTIGATLRYVSDRQQSFGSAAYRLPDYTTVDLRAGFTLGAVNTQLYLRNLFDERGQLSSLTYFGGGLSRTAILQPRTIGVTASMRFD